MENLSHQNPAEATENRLRRGLEYLTLGSGGPREMGPSYRRALNITFDRVTEIGKLEKGTYL